MKRVLKKQKKAQTFIEYVIILTIVVTALYSISPLIKRGIQSMVKVTADHVGAQNESDQYRLDNDDGYMVSSTFNLNSSINKTRNESSGGNVNYVYDDDIRSKTVTRSNLGVTQR